MHPTTISHVPTKPVLPIIHVHIPESLRPLTDSMTANIPTAANVGGPGLTHQFAMYLDSKDEFDDEHQTDIRQLLETLHTKFPALNYLQYEASLFSLGIAYLTTATLFDADFFASKVRMTDGAAQLFHQQVFKEVKKASQAKQQRKAKGKKRVQVMTKGEEADERENIVPNA